MKNKNLQQAIKLVTIAGSAILIVNSGMKLTGVSSLKGAVMPVVTILVGLSAFNYAMSNQTLTIKKS